MREKKIEVEKGFTKKTREVTNGDSGSQLLFLFEYLHAVLCYLYALQHFRGKYCIFNSTALISLIPTTNFGSK